MNLPNRDAHILVQPHVVDRVLPTCGDGPTLHKREGHVLHRVFQVQEHKDNAVAGVSGPVLCWGHRVAGPVDLWVVRIADLERIISPAERADTRADVWILVDFDNILVA